jgi:hypothetical protein
VLSQAAGLWTVHERMVVMPDDPRLGEYRAEFAGMVGMFFEFPQPASSQHPGFHDATQIISHKELYERLPESPDTQVATEEFLRARLFDIFIGDFDRHKKQWRWAQVPGDSRWHPIPEDRDMAFVRYDGAGPRIASIYIPILQDYGPKYPFMKGLTFHGWEQDRWLLPKLSWPVWEKVATDMQARLTDEVIEEAIRALPPEYVELDGDRLRESVRGRRDRLLEGARAYYEHLAGQVDIQATNAAERVDATWGEDGSIEVVVNRVDAPAGATPIFSRRFSKDETGDLRVYLRDGDDRVTVVGEPGCIKLRLIAGRGNKSVDDSRAGDTIIYDELDNVAVERGDGTYVENRHYELPPEEATFVDVKDIPPRDWGFDLIPIPLFGYEREVGAFLGAGAVWTNYGFRKHPWSSRHKLTAGYGTTANKERVIYEGSVRPENSQLLGNLELKTSGLEVLRWHGYGNNTKDNLQNKTYRVRNRQLRAAPAVQIDMDEFQVSGGPWIEWWKTSSGGNRLINQLQPNGSGRFGMVGAFAKVAYDTRTSVSAPDDRLVLHLHENVAAGYPTAGFFAELMGEVSPPVWGPDKTWGALEGSVSTYFSWFDRDRLTLALRAGGRSTFGNAPYQKAAYIGGGLFFSGGSTVRGFRQDRFAGDHSVFGNADLRFVVGQVKLVVPGDYGVLAFTDVGRVFLDDESSSKWHPGYGGGVFFAPLARTNAISLTVGASDEDTLVYLRVGFAY